MTREAHPEWLSPLEHTADTGMVVVAPELPELFARCGWGLMAIVTDPEQVAEALRLDIEVEADDLAALMVRWLSELNYLHITQHLLFAAFEIMEFSESRLRATVRGESIDAARHTVHTEIKAVTFHGLSIDREPEGWRARVIFDL